MLKLYRAADDFITVHRKIASLVVSGEKCRMLEVTTRAREKLKEALLEEQANMARASYRITPIPTMPSRLGIALDREKRGDQVVKSRDGLVVLLIQADLSRELEGMVLDYRDTPRGMRFTLNRVPSSRTDLGGKRWN